MSVEQLLALLSGFVILLCFIEFSTERMVGWRRRGQAWLDRKINPAPPRYERCEPKYLRHSLHATGFSFDLNGPLDPKAMEMMFGASLGRIIELPESAHFTILPRWPQGAPYDWEEEEEF